MRIARPWVRAANKTWYVYTDGKQHHRGNSMKFGQVDNPDEIDFTIPPDHPDTANALKAQTLKSNDLEVFVGCAKWNKQDLKNFFPRGTKDELAYYATQFNCIELNATFYRLFPPATFDKWYATAPKDFRFFPKLEQTISHFRRLKDVKEIVEHNVANMSHLREKLKMPFLQMRDDFGPKDFERVAAFAETGHTKCRWRWSFVTPIGTTTRQFRASFTICWKRTASQTSLSIPQAVAT